MGAKTGISWCDSTWNPIVGCSPISEGCTHCWASAMVKRFPNLNGGKPFSDIRFYPERLSQPSKWKKPRRIFVGGMTDLFHECVPDEWRNQVFDVMSHCTQHCFLSLTKRPSRALEYFLYRIKGSWPLSNAMVGVTAEGQRAADDRIPMLLSTFAIKTWVSLEPLLSPVTLRQFFRPSGLDFVVIGCESGPGRRPMKLEWAEALVEECRSAGIACFVKQIEIDGKVVHDIERFPPSLQVREWPK